MVTKIHFPQRLSTLLLLGTLLGLAAVPASSAPGDVETVLLFDPLRFETPESVTTALNGDLFIGSAFTGEIFRLDRHGELTVFATLPIETIGAPCAPGGFPALLGAITITPFGTIYANFAACEAADRGVWRIDRHGNGERIVPLGFDVLPNGLERVLGRLFIADSNGSVLTASVAGGEATLWSDDPLLAEDPSIFAPGPNGIQFFEGELYVANSDTAQIIAFPLKLDGTAGTPRIHAQLPFGCDDFAFDRRGAIFCTTDPANVVLEVSPDGSSSTIILDASDGLDGPTAAAFGRGADRFTLYVTNAAFPFFTITNRPSLISIELEHPRASFLQTGF